MRKDTMFLNNQQTIFDKKHIRPITILKIFLLYSQGVMPIRYLMF